MVEEGINTPTKKSMQAKQMLDINAMFGREVFTPSKIIPLLNISGKDEILKDLQQQEQAMQAHQQHEQMVAQSLEEAKLKELYSKAVSNIAIAKERVGRSESDLGLYEERISKIATNRALSTKAKTEALAKLMEVIQKYGDLEAHLKLNELNSLDSSAKSDEDQEKSDVQKTAMSNDFMVQMLAGIG